MAGKTLVFVEYLASNLGNQPHSWAMQKLKEDFGGSQGMASGKKSDGRQDIEANSSENTGDGSSDGLPPAPQNLFGEDWE